ncbi:MAG: carbohydrate kinase [Oscillospiraceae bacterium]|nr:carbohydrate kinase [Oscillospiraceae bacterium]
MSGIAALGEVIIDFTYLENENGQPMFKQNAGGAPANVACMVAKLGVKTGFIGKIGKDMFGGYLRRVLSDCGVDTRGLISDKNFFTTLAFVRRNEEGDRDFVFYRNDKISADLNLSYSEIDLTVIDDCDIFHFGALSLTCEPTRSATMNAIEYAKLKGKIISYDPNWREDLWESKESAVKAMRSVLQYVDIIKLSEKELQILTGCDTLLPSVAYLLKAGVKMICITQGAKGCIIASRKGIERYSGFDTPITDTLGSGDSFYAGFLYKLLDIGKPLEELTPEDKEELAVFANACGALSASKKGTIPSMPVLKSVEELIALREDK